LSQALGCRSTAGNDKNQVPMSFRTPEDVLWRRTNIGLLFTSENKAALETWMIKQFQKAIVADD